MRCDQRKHALLCSSLFVCLCVACSGIQGIRCLDTRDGTEIGLDGDSGADLMLPRGRVASRGSDQGCGASQMLHRMH